MGIKIYKILEKTTVEGPDTRFCIWTQGCKRQCPGCWAENTWDSKGGTDYSVEELFNKINSTQGIDGVTFLGGEPFEQAKELSLLAEKIKEANLSLIVFTGYTLEELTALKNNDINKLLSHTDLLIDGAFEQENFDTTRPWIGSSNQRYIFLTNRYSIKDINKAKNKVEVRISKNGELFINGMGDFKRLQEDLSLQKINNKLYF